jgi:hypothetical protein
MHRHTGRPETNRVISFDRLRAREERDVAMGGQTRTNRSSQGDRQSIRDPGQFLVT